MRILCVNSLKVEQGAAADQTGFPSLPNPLFLPRERGLGVRDDTDS